MTGLEGKRILVAGSATGIGAATARRLADDGARVLLGDINSDVVKKVAEDLDAPWAWFDLHDPDSIGRLLATTVDTLGGLDGIANIAADLSPEVLYKDTDVLTMNVEVWHKTLNANLVGFALLIQAALPHLLAAGGGSIVNTTSDASDIGEDTRPAYAASKAGINALTRHVAVKYGPEGIRCNSVSPGMVLTETAEAAYPTEFLQSVLVGLPLGRLGRPEELAAAYAYLFSDDCRWLSGQVISINGGKMFRG